jgi:NAD(P)-dependent dehydrogenase (short-subunit alcohol dehydrogenase family)
MKNFAEKIAVITGCGSGIGRELALQLVAMGCDVAMCDAFPENMAETKRLCMSQAPQGTRVSTFVADVSSEDQVLAFAEAVTRDLGTDQYPSAVQQCRNWPPRKLRRRQPRRMGENVWRLLVRCLFLYTGLPTVAEERR